jgi:DNA polymerase III subunit gamma/tau
MSYLVLARKWRPITFDELTGQEPIAGILKNSILGNKVAHAYIFSGPRGVGKTSTARILAKTLNCEQPVESVPCGKCASCLSITDGSSMDVTEIDGASNTGVDNIRDLRERVRYASYGGAYKVYIIDEAHMLSTAAFNALLKTLEEPPPHVIFVLATTDPKKIPATVLSRCQHLPFRRITTHKIKERLKQITTAEGLNIADAALEMVARAADGSMRDSLTILDQVASFADTISAEDVKDLLGFTDMQTLSVLAEAIITGDRKGIIDMISSLVESGTDLKTFTKDYLQFMRDLLIARICGDSGDIMDLSEEEVAVITGLTQKTNEEHLALLLSELIKSEPAIRAAMFPRIALEMTLLRMSMMSHFTAVDEAIKMLGSSGAAKISASVSHKDVLPKEVISRESKPIIDGGVKEPALSVKPVVTIQPSEPVKRPEQADIAKPTAPIPELSVQETWGRVIKRLENENTPLSSKILQGSVIMSDKDITIQFNGGMSVLAESVKENVPLIQKHILEISGKNIHITVATKEVKPISQKDLKDKALKNPIVKEALDLFEGRIADIYPINDKDGGAHV